MPFYNFKNITETSADIEVYGEIVEKRPTNWWGDAVEGMFFVSSEFNEQIVDLGSEFDNAYDAIRIGTGATGEALQGLEDDFKSVYSSVPTTMEDASTAIADYNTRLGLTGPELQNISKQAIQVADMLDEDLGTVIEDSSKAFQIWNISADDMGGAMDYVFKASQSTGTGFNDLMADVQRFAPQLQELGYGFENSVALIGSLDKAGVNTTEVLSAMKKSVSSFAKEGLSAEEGLQKYTDKIKNAKDMTDHLYKSIVADNITLLSLLKKLCLLEGIAIVFYNKTIVLFDENRIENIDCTGSLVVENDDVFAVSNSENKLFNECVVKNNDINGKFKINAKNNNTLIFTEDTPATTVGEANRFAKGILRNINKTTKTGSVTTELKTEYAAGTVVNLCNSKLKSYNGKIFIYKTRHDFVNNKTKIFFRYIIEDY